MCALPSKHSDETPAVDFASLKSGHESKKYFSIAYRVHGDTSWKLIIDSANKTFISRKTHCVGLWCSSTVYLCLLLVFLLKATGQSSSSLKTFCLSSKRLFQIQRSPTTFKINTKTTTGWMTENLHRYPPVFRQFDNYMYIYCMPNIKTHLQCPRLWAVQSSPCQPSQCDLWD